MELAKLLWVDLRVNRQQSSLLNRNATELKIVCITDAEKISVAVRKFTPDIICFEYDYPKYSDLIALQQIKRDFPSIPILMLTEQHSEALAVWAFRSRVWDYLVKPLPSHELINQTRRLMEVQKKTGSTSAGRRIFVPFRPVPPEPCLHADRDKKTLPALSFVETHYHEKVRETEVAQLCGMDVSSFSRTFRKENTVTFRNYLSGYRICKAQELLQDHNATVKAVAFTVGYYDPSYFSRMFRQITGQRPSVYRDNYKLCRSR